MFHRRGSNVTVLRFVFRYAVEPQKRRVHGKCPRTARVFLLRAREASRQRPFFSQFSFNGENPLCLRLTWKRRSASKSVENFYCRYVFPECKGVLLSITTGSTSAFVQQRKSGAMILERGQAKNVWESHMFGS